MTKIKLLYCMIFIVACSNIGNEKKRTNVFELCSKNSKIMQDSNINISIDSSYCNLNFYYEFQLTNNSDSTIFIETIKQKLDDRYYIPLLSEEFELDSCNCIVKCTRGYHEYFGVKHKIIEILPKYSYYFEGFTYHHLCFWHGTKKDYIFNLIFDYYYGRQNFLNKKDTTSGILFSVDNDKVVPLKNSLLGNSIR